jgi:hypothetical protein
MINDLFNPWRLAALLAALTLGGAALVNAGSGPCVESTVVQALASTGADADARARARLRQRDDCGVDFAVEVEDLPAGSYELVVGGVGRGLIAVVDTGAGIQGEIEFEAADDTPHPLVLDFDPLGSLMEIRAGGTTFFSDILDGVSPAPPATASPSPTRTPGVAAATETVVPTGTRTRVPTVARTSTPARTGTVARTATQIRTRTATRIRTATRTRTAPRVRTATRTRTTTRVRTTTPTPAAPQATPS